MQKAQNFNGRMYRILHSSSVQIHLNYRDGTTLCVSNNSKNISFMYDLNLSIYQEIFLTFFGYTIAVQRIFLNSFSLSCFSIIYGLLESTTIVLTLYGANKTSDDEVQFISFKFFFLRAAQSWLKKLNFPSTYVRVLLSLETNAISMGFAFDER